MPVLLRYFSALIANVARILGIPEQHWHRRTRFYVGPEAEFFVFDSIRTYGGVNGAGYEIQSSEGHCSPTAIRNMPGKPGPHHPPEGRLFPVPPIDQQQEHPQ